MQSLLREAAALNDRMTVRQPIGLFAFLQATYKVVPPTCNPYARIYPSARRGRGSAAAKALRTTH